MISPSWYQGVAPEARRAFWSTFGGFAVAAMSVQLYSFALPTLLSLWTLSPWQAGVLASATLLSGALGGWVAGALSDKFGRIRVLKLTIVALALSTICCGLASSYESLLVARIVQGLCFGAEWAVGAVFINEAAPPTRRGRLVGAAQSAWAVGWGLAAAISFIALSQLTPQLGWRLPFLVGIVPAGLVLWLRVRLRRQLTTAPIESTARWHAIFSKKLLGKTALATILATGVHAGYWAIATWWPAMLHLELEMSAPESARQFAFLIGGSFIGYLVGGWCSDQAGRRISVSLFAAGGSAAVAAATLLPIHAFALPVLSIMIGFFSVGLYSSLSPLLAELFTTSMRGSGLGFCYNAGRAVAALTPLAVAASIPAHGIGVSLAVTVTAAYGLAICTVFLLPDTRGRELTEACAGACFQSPSSESVG